MAFLQKWQGQYRIGWQERVPFSHANPPTDRNGKVLAAAVKAIQQKKQYFFRTKWKWLGRITKEQAEQIKAGYEKAKIPKTAFDDVLFRDAIKEVIPYFTDRPDFERDGKYRVKEFEGLFGSRYISTIKPLELQGYMDTELGKGNAQATVRRKLVMLRTLFRLFKEKGLHTGESPFAGIKLHYFGGKPREITLEDSQQRDLLRACYDERLTAIFLACRKQVRTKKGVRGKKLYDAVNKDTFRMFEKRAKEVMALGYPDVEKTFQHLLFQNQGRTIDPAVLYDIVYLTLTYGLRKGEIVGVGYTQGGKTVRRDGLRAGHWDAEKRILTVLRTKVKKSGGVKISRWMVTPKIAAMLDRYCQGKKLDEFIFTNNGNQIHDFAKSFEVAVKFAGVEIESINDKGMKEMIRPVFRDLRHVATCNMLDAGMTVEEVMRVLGHTTSKMVQMVYGNRMKESTMKRHSELVAVGMDRILGA